MFQEYVQMFERRNNSKPVAKVCVTTKGKKKHFFYFTPKDIHIHSFLKIDLQFRLQ